MWPGYDWSRVLPSYISTRLPFRRYCNKSPLRSSRNVWSNVETQRPYSSIFLKLFDNQIRPILLYAFEVWGIMSTMKWNWYICSPFFVKKKRLLNVAVIYFKNLTDNHCLPECCQILILRAKMKTGIAVDVIWFCALKSWLCFQEFTLLTCLPCLIWYIACYIVYTMTLVTMEWCGCPGVGSSQIQLYGSV